MSTPAELESEIAQLRKDLAALREEFDYVIRVDREDDGTFCSSRVSAHLFLSKMFIILGPKGQVMGMISSDETGPSITLHGQDDKTHLMLSVTGNTGTIRIMGDNGETAIEMTEDERHGQVVAFSPGEVPRAILKGMATGGAIAALSSDGRPRALVHSIKECGEIVVAKDKVHAKLTSSESGGALSIFDGAGERATTINATPMGNSISIHTPGAKAAISLAATPLGTSVRVGLAGEGDQKSAAIDLQELPGHGGNIMCRDATGAVAVDLGTAGEGGSISISNGAQGGQISLHTKDGGGVVEVIRTDSDNRVLLTAARTGALATVIGADDTAAYMQITPQGSGSIGLKKQDRLQGFLGVSEDGENGVIMLTNPDNSNAVHLSAAKEGGRVLLGSNDGTTQAALFSSGEGSQLTLFNELGIERATLAAKQDSGGLHLRYGGHTGIVAAASERGGIITLHDGEGEIDETLPSHGREDDSDESS
jgi:hypothetical protein